MNLRLAIPALLLMVGGLGACASKPGGDCCCMADKPPLRHVVIFKFKDGTPPEQVAAIEKKFGELKGKIPGVLDFEFGTNVSPEKLDQGCTHCFIVTFPDVAARDAYLPHPAHQEFVGILKPHLDKVFVIDYVVRT